MATTHAANALRVTTKMRIQVRAGAQTAGSSAARREHDDPGVADDRVADDVLEVVLDERREAARTLEGRRSERRSGAPRRRATSSGATDASIQASATIASDAGATAVRIGSAASGRRR